VCGIAINGSELRAKHMLSGAVSFQGLLDVVHPSFGTVNRLRPEAQNFDVIGEAGAVQVEIPFIHAGRILEHHVLQRDAVRDMLIRHSCFLTP